LSGSAATNADQPANTISRSQPDGPGAFQLLTANSGTLAIIDNANVTW